MLAQGKVCSFDLYQEKFTILIEKDVRSLFVNKTLYGPLAKTASIITPNKKKAGTVHTIPAPVLSSHSSLCKNDTIWAISPARLSAIPRKEPSGQTKLASFNNDAKCLFVDHSNNVWIGSWSGVYRFSPSQNIITHYTNARGELSHNQIRCINEDNSGNIWIGTFRGIDCYHPQTNSWSHYTEYGDSPNTLSHNSILALHKDKQGNIWAGTYFGGVNILIRKSKETISIMPTRFEQTGLTSPLSVK